MKKISVEVQGTTPLLMNRFRDKQIDDDTKQVMGARKKEELIDKLYLVDDEPCIPGVYFKNAITEAAKQFKIVGKGKSTYSKLVGSTVQIGEEYCVIDGGYEVFRISGVNPMTKGRVMISRPRFNKWKTKCTILLMDDGVPPNVMNDMLVHAGQYVGVGDWRPDKKGMFGKFIVTSYKEVA